MPAHIFFFDYYELEFSIRLFILLPFFAPFYLKKKKIDQKRI